jgi:hypothetical protein
MDGTEENDAFNKVNGHMEVTKSQVPVTSLQYWILRRKRSGELWYTASLSRMLKRSYLKNTQYKIRLSW